MNKIKQWFKPEKEFKISEWVLIGLVTSPVFITGGLTLIMDRNLLPGITYFLVGLAFLILSVNKVKIKTIKKSK